MYQIYQDLPPRTEATDAKRRKMTSGEESMLKAIAGRMSEQFKDQVYIDC